MTDPVPLNVTVALADIAACLRRTADTLPADVDLALLITTTPGSPHPSLQVFGRRACRFEIAGLCLKAAEQA